jgi:hypothetical protein
VRLELPSDVHWRGTRPATIDAAERWLEPIERETGRYLADVFA